VSSTFKGGPKTSISRVAFLLSSGGFALGISRASSGGITSDLCRANWYFFPE
jgi:hypothetical protein